LYLQPAAALVLGGFLLAIPLGAHADEQMQTLAVSGNWVAVAHRADMIAAPDVCGAMTTNPSTGRELLFRMDLDGMQIRVADEKWSLPANVSGDIAVNIGPIAKAFHIDSNTSSMVSAPIPASEVTMIFDAMDKASGMLVKVGNEAPYAVSLAGSTRVTNAFRTCAGISGNAPGGGANPFQ
jgi:hypothetical protein